MDTNVASVAPPGDAITESDLCTWLGDAAPGDQLVYHRGFLALDCDPTTDRLTPRQKEQLRRVARRAMFVAENGLAHLVQRRNGPDDFTYLLIVRARQTEAVSGRKSTILA